MRAIRSKNRTDPVAYASYQVIAKHIEARGKPPTGLYFNKIMSLLHRELKREGLDIKLPHCWYRWGDEVVRYLMPNAVVWDHEEANMTTVHWKEDAPGDICDHALKKNITYHVSELTSKYSGSRRIDDAVSEVYDEAPFDFQRKYKACRDAFAGVRGAGIRISNYGEDHIWPMLNDAFESFPANDFPHVAERVPAVRELLHKMLLKEEPPYALANEVSEEFWAWFCYYLRLNPRCHENVPRETIDHWSEVLEEEERRFRRMLGDHALDVVERCGESEISADLQHMADERMESLEEEDEILASFKDDIDGLNDFLHQMKAARRKQ